MIRILKASNLKKIEQLMRQIQVDPYGVKIMAPKGINHLIKVGSLSCIAANILKQELLSLGGDAALAKSALTGGYKKTDCLIMASDMQLNRLIDKLRKQPFGLRDLAQDLAYNLSNYNKDNFVLKLAGKDFNLGGRAKVMGILNLTPDSFSGDGVFQSPARKCALEVGRIVEFAQRMVDDGADIIDIGGESSRPGAKPVSVKEELSRVVPALKALVKKIRVPISVDTYKPEVARQVINNGAAIINDITGARNSDMLKVVAKNRAAIVIMHMKGTPRTMQKNLDYKDLINDVMGSLKCSVDRAMERGIKRERIIIDPGIGFGKKTEHNLSILNRLGEFRIFGLPILVGPSRKSFIGNVLNAGLKDRTAGTISAAVIASLNGAKIIRAHDVKQVTDALKMSNAILNS